MLLNNADRIVASARTWVGTPFQHQRALKGVGCDCIGLIVAVMRDLGQEPAPEDYDEYYYSRTPNPRAMGAKLAKYFDKMDFPIRTPAPDGAIAWMQWRHGLPMHLAIMATFEGRRTMIHAFEHVGKVVEHGFSGEWPRRVASWWKFRG